MKNKLFVILLLAGIIILPSCSGNRAPQQGNDTVSKADATKDTLRFDTNKNTDKTGNTGQKKDAIDTPIKTLPHK